MLATAQNTQQRELESFCETCEELVCLECIVKLHKGHELECNMVSDLFKGYREDILSSLDPVLPQLCKVKEKLC